MKSQSINTNQEVELNRENYTSLTIFHKDGHYNTMMNCDNSDDEELDRSTQPDNDSERNFSPKHNRKMEISTFKELKNLKQLGNSNDSKLFDINRGLGLMWMFVSAMMTTIMNVIIKTTIKDVNVQESAVIRAIFLAIGCYLHLRKDKVNVFDYP